MLIYKGAEAELYREQLLGLDVVRKVRLPKKYKQPELDERLRSERLKTEARMLSTARTAVRTPHVLFVDDSTIIMEAIDGTKVKDLFIAGKIDCAKSVGEAVRRLHDAGIVHNDLTTSNMIFKDKEIWLIDFGLSANSTSQEDRAVDLAVLKHMLSSTHYDVFDKVWPAVLAGYKADKAMLKRIETVESRAKYK